MSSQVSGPDTSPGAHGSLRSWLPAGAFLAGCALGGVVMGVADLGDDGAPSGPTESAVAAGPEADAGDGGAAADGSAGGSGSGLYVRVPDSCVQTAEDATSLVGQVDRVVAAVAALEPERLRQTVDDVQQVRDEVQDVADQCRAAAAQRLQDAADADDDAAPPTPTS